MQRMDGTKGIAPESAPHLKHAGAEAMQRFRYRGLASLGSDRQRVRDSLTNRLGKFLEVPERRRQPGYGAVC